MSVRMVLLGEAWGANEAEAKAPFVGASGSLLNKLCTEAGIVSPRTGEALGKALWSRNYSLRDRIFSNGVFKRFTIDFGGRGK